MDTGMQNSNLIGIVVLAGGVVLLFSGISGVLLVVILNLLGYKI